MQDFEVKESCPKYPMRKEELHANRSKKVQKHTSILADRASIARNGFSSEMFGALDSCWHT